MLNVLCNNFYIRTSDASERNRNGRQQNGDTYTLEISFPAVKYVINLVAHLKNGVNGATHKKTLNASLLLLIMHTKK